MSVVSNIERKLTGNDQAKEDMVMALAPHSNWVQQVPNKDDEGGHSVKSARNQDIIDFRSYHVPTITNPSYSN